MMLCCILRWLSLIKRMKSELQNKYMKKEKNGDDVRADGIDEILKNRKMDRFTRKKSNVWK